MDDYRSVGKDTFGLNQVISGGQRHVNALVATADNNSSNKGNTTISINGRRSLNTSSSTSHPFLAACFHPHPFPLTILSSDKPNTANGDSHTCRGHQLGAQ
jgi:hypothetical protein